MNRISGNVASMAFGRSYEDNLVAANYRLRRKNYAFNGLPPKAQYLYPTNSAYTYHNAFLLLNHLIAAKNKLG